jgi:hypothetical protein
LILAAPKLSEFNATLQVAEKGKNAPFRGTLRAEESLFSWRLRKERFLTSFGMTIKGIFSATCLAADFSMEERQTESQVCDSLDVF